MKKRNKRNADRSRSFAVAGIGLCVSAVAMGAAKEGSQVVDQVVSAFRDNAYPGAGLIRLGRVYRNTGSGELKEEDVVSTDVAFKKNLEISLKYDELILQEYAGDVIKVDTANDEKRRCSDLRRCR